MKQKRNAWISRHVNRYITCQFIWKSIKGKRVMGLDKIPVRAGEDTIRTGQGF